jgi:List-Bact-rpt repeat protein/all-beta uncharacterized protein
VNAQSGSGIVRPQTAATCPSLTLTDLQPPSFITSTAGYQPSLVATGTNFTNVTKAMFNWSGAANGNKTWNKGDADWNSKVTVSSDTSMTLRPVVVGSSDPTGTTSWTVTLTDATAATASRSFTVTYTPTSCSYTLSASSASFAAAGGNGSVGVSTSASGCSWTATSNASWVTITSGSSGTGNGTVGYTVAANPSTSGRTGTVSIQGQTFTVNQDGAGSSTVSVTVATSPTGLLVTVDNTNYTAPQGFSWTPGSTHTIRTLFDQLSPDQRTAYTFSSWSDAGGQTHQVSPSSNTTYTATFTVRYLLTTSVSGNGSISVSPGGPWYNPGQLVQLTANSGSGSAFSSWSGDCAGQGNPCSLTLNGPRSATANFTAANSTVSITLATSPTGLTVTADGASYTAPKSLSWTAGSDHTVSTPSPQLSGDQRTRYTFASWSDGGAQSHQFNAPVATTTYTANFATQYLLTTSVSGNGNISVSPGGPWYNPGQVVQLTANPGSGATFSNWGGDCAGQGNPCILTMNGPRSATANFTAALSAPTLNSATPICSGTDSQIQLQWTGVSGASNYEIWRNGSLYFTTATNGTTFTNINLTSGQSYTYQIRATNGTTTSGFSNSLGATALSCTVSLGTPTLNSVTPVCSGTDSEIQLQWTGVSGANHYEIWRNGSLYFTTATNGTTFTNINLTAGQSYTYQVRAVSGSTTSGFSNGLGATALNCAPTLGTPTLFTPTSDCPSKSPGLHLNWSTATGASRYDLYRNSSFYINNGTNTTFYNNANVSFGVFYSYFIRAVSATGQTADSNSQSIQATCRVTVGGTGGVGLKLRQCASTNNTTCPVITTLSDGTVMTIFGGPVAADGYNWYAIQGAAGTGWAAGDWLIP